MSLPQIKSQAAFLSKIILLASFFASIPSKLKLGKNLPSLAFPKKTPAEKKVGLTKGFKTGFTRKKRSAVSTIKSKFNAICTPNWEAKSVIALVFIVGDPVFLVYKQRSLGFR